MKTKLVFASTNEFKIKEVKEMFKDSDYEILSLLDFPEIADVDETADTLIGNAKLKVETVAKQINYPVFADDSGFFVDALDGAPGVHSARWTGTHRDYATQNAKILNLMKKETDRKASYETVIAFKPNKEEKTKLFIGVMPLTVAKEETEIAGFSYDTIVTYKEKYVAEMCSEEKNNVSSRAKAVDKLIHYLDGLV